MKIEHTGKPESNSLRLAQCELDLDTAKSAINLLTAQVQYLQEDIAFVKSAFTRILGETNGKKEG